MWVRGQLLIMLAISVMAGVSFLLLGLPNPLVLAVLAGLFETLRPTLEEPTPRVPVPEAELAGDEHPDPAALAAQAR